MDSFEIRFAIHTHIVPFLSGPTLLALCQTHRDFRSFFESFVVGVRKMMLIKEQFWRIKYAARYGVQSGGPSYRRELCELVREWASIPEGDDLVVQPLDYSWLLSQAARGKVSLSDSYDLCILARKWAREAVARGDPIAPIDWDKLLCSAARARNRELCILVRDWTREAHEVLQCDNMLQFAARAGSYELCLLAREWARERHETLHWWSMICSAVRGHDLHSALKIYELAREWSREEHAHPEQVIQIMDVNDLLHCAARGRNLECAREFCKLARTWAREANLPLDCNGMLWGAAYRGHYELCLLAREWSLIPAGSNVPSGHAEGVTPGPVRSVCGMNWRLNLSQMFASAASAGCRNICELALEWSRIEGQQLDWNWILKETACGQYGSGKRYGSSSVREMCELVREWSRESTLTQPMDWNGMLYGAVITGDRELCILAREWAREAVARGDPVLPMDWGAMMRYAADRGNRELCILAHEWLLSSGGISAQDKSNWNGMLISAAESGYRNLCILARKLAREALGLEVQLDLDQMLQTAIDNDRFNIVDLARSWMVASGNPSLRDAESAGNPSRRDAESASKPS